MSRILFAIVSLVLLAGSTFGHSSLERSEPKDGETLKVAPAEIRMWFTEPIKLGLSTFEVRNAAGKPIDQRDLRADEKQPALVRLSLPANLSSGTYKVTWSAVAQDLHVSQRKFQFSRRALTNCRAPSPLAGSLTPVARRADCRAVQGHRPRLQVGHAQLVNQP